MDCVVIGHIETSPSLDELSGEPFDSLLLYLAMLEDAVARLS